MATMVPRPAATLVLLREGMEVLMLQRTQNAAFLGGAYVFPGGSLDPQDADMHRVVGLTEQQANERLQLDSGAIAYYVAAIRECFEEAGILLARDRNGDPVTAERAEQLTHWRKKPFREMLEAEDLYIPAGELAYFGHWITAPGRSRRFNARFFLALAPLGQRGSNDANETVHDVWITQREALERGARGEIELVNATQTTLKDLSRFAEPRAAYEHARSLPEVEENRACWAQGKEGPKIFRRRDPQYFEIHWVDPEETGHSSYDIVGHSAGGQFVHRLVLFVPEARFRRAVVSSPGRYAFPSAGVQFPYGLRGSPADTATLRRAFQRDVLLLLGDKDVADQARAWEPETAAQGRNRFARGLHFFASAAEEAFALGTPLAWRLRIAEGVDHDPPRMVRAALDLLKN